MNIFRPRWFIRQVAADKVYFNYKRAPFFPNKWMLYLLLLIELAILVTEIILNHSAYCQIVLFPLVFYYMDRILRHKELVDKTTERTIVEEYLSLEINQLCSESAQVVAKEYCIITPKTLYMREKRFLLVVMSNGNVFRFAVESGEKKGYVLNKKATTCSDPAELELVKKYTERTETDKQIKAKRLMGKAAAIILCLGMAVIALVMWIGSKQWAKVLGYILLADLLLSLVLVLVLDSFDGKKNFAGALYKIASWNAKVWYLLIQLIFPSLLLLVGLFGIVFLPSGLIYIVSKGVVEAGLLTLPTCLFISLSLGSIISAHYSRPLFGWISRLLMANGHRYEKYSQGIVEYVYQPANIEFAVNFAYVIYLCVSTIVRLQSGGSLYGSETDLAVLESFLVFIAFSNMKKKRESASFSFPKLFRMIYAMWTTRDFEDDED